MPSKKQPKKSLQKKWANPNKQFKATKIGIQTFNEQYLWAIALKTSTKAGYYFGPDCESDFKNEISKAVKKMVLNSKIPEQLNYSEIENNIATLVNEMIDYMNKIEPLSNRLAERSLLESLKKLCPLNPFC